MSPVDLIVVEGYKAAAIPKLEVHRAAIGKPLLHPDDNCIVAVAADAPLPQVDLPVVSLDDIETIADVVTVEAAPLERVSAAQGAD
jgi:molybdopterin-guanine dinucleotide biosynthesis protein B